MLLFIIYYLLSPLIYIILYIASFYNKKLNIIIDKQNKSLKKIRTRIKTNKKKIIIHAASAGEYEQIKPILRFIDKNIYFVIVTCMSPTIYESIKKDNLSDAYCYHPFDLPWLAKKFFNTIKPSIYLTTRHDIWPIHLYHAKKMNIKTIIINANLYQKSKRLKWYSINISKYIFNFFDLIIVPSKSIKNLFKNKLNINNTIIVNDTRFEQIIDRKNSSNGIPKFEPIYGKNNIIFGSISYEDIKLFEVINMYMKNPKLSGNIIIVPHEIDTDLIIKIEDSIINSCRFSTLKANDLNVLDNNRKICIIVDKVGILPELYKYTKIAYVGGGFGKGVHSTTEPLIYNNIVCYGPNIDLLNEAKEMHENGCGFIINNSKEFWDIVNNEFLSSKGNKEYQSLRLNIEKMTAEYITKKVISTKKICEIINEYT